MTRLDTWLGNRVTLNQLWLIQRLTDWLVADIPEWAQARREATSSWPACRTLPAWSVTAARHSFCCREWPDCLSPDCARTTTRWRASWRGRPRSRMMSLLHWKQTKWAFTRRLPGNQNLPQRQIPIAKVREYVRGHSTRGTGQNQQPCCVQWIHFECNDQEESTEWEKDELGHHSNDDAHWTTHVAPYLVRIRKISLILNSVYYLRILVCASKPKA